MLYQKILEKEFLGKQIHDDINIGDEMDIDSTWELDDDDSKAGYGLVFLQECSVSDEWYDDFDSDDYDSDDCDDDDTWVDIRTYLYFEVNKKGIISKIEIRAEAIGGDALGEVDPEEEWSNSDLQGARDFLNSIIKH